MIVNRRSFLTAGAAAALAASGKSAALAANTKTKVGDNGLHVQDWFLESFLELPEDFAGAAQRGKGLIVLFEQRGCPYCVKLHDVNLAKASIRTYMKKNFETVQLDIFGSREVTDFDGQAMEERKLASRWGVTYTPSTVFFAGTPENSQGKTGREAEVARMPGYLKPFHFLSMLKFVTEGHYKKSDFQSYLQGKLAEYQAKGIKPEVQ